jgi:hypothetical protein
MIQSSSRLATSIQLMDTIPEPPKPEKQGKGHPLIYPIVCVSKH